MERSDRVNGTLHPQPIIFALRDEATGKVRPIRDMTDQEIERHAQNCAAELAKQQSALAVAMSQVLSSGMTSLIQIKGVMAALHYEAHRRSCGPRVG